MALTREELRAAEADAWTELKGAYDRLAAALPGEVAPARARVAFLRIVWEKAYKAVPVAAFENSQIAALREAGFSEEVIRRRR